MFDRASLVAQRLKRLPPMPETRVDPWVRKIPWRRKWQSSPVFLPGESHGWRSLEGYSPRGHRVGHNWATSLHFTLQCTFKVSLGLQAIPLQECLPVELEAQQLPGLLQMNNCELRINHGQWNPIEFWNIWGQQWRVHKWPKIGWRPNSFTFQVRKNDIFFYVVTFMLTLCASCR